MIFINKLAVFDLDDTLYEGNSHFSIVNEYYQTKNFTSIPMRAIGKFFPAIRLKLINLFYNRIPLNYRQHYLLPYRQDVLQILKNKQSNGYTTIIVSNAPIDLLKAAANDLHMDYVVAAPQQKAKALRKQYQYKRLFVCTDNKTDIDLLSIADEAVITCREKDKQYFEKKLADMPCKYKFCCKKES